MVGRVGWLGGTGTWDGVLAFEMNLNIETYITWISPHIL